MRERPPLFAPGETLFWDDDHISTQMLQAHLDPTTNAASYRPERLEQSGFQARSIGSDLTGAPYAEDSEWHRHHPHL